jgi:hypothetical protein
MMILSLGAGGLGPFVLDEFPAVCDAATGRTPFACDRLFAAEDATMTAASYIEERKCFCDEVNVWYIESMCGERRIIWLRTKGQSVVVTPAKLMFQSSSVVQVGGSSPSATDKDKTCALQPSGRTDSRLNLVALKVMVQDDDHQHQDLD